MTQTVDLYKGGRLLTGRDTERQTDMQAGQADK